MSPPFQAASWQIEAAWQIVRGISLPTNIPRSTAFRMLREQGHADLIKAMKGPVAEAAYKEGVIPLAQFIFATNSKLKAQYDTGAYGEITMKKVLDRLDRDGPVLITGKMWHEMQSRIEKLEQQLKEK